MKKFLSTVLILLNLTAIGFGQHVDRSKFVKDSLDYYINHALTNWRIPGAAVCIVKDNKIVMMQAYGIKELGQPDKVDINTLFMIGSNSKAFTATSLAILQTQGKLSLDDKVTKYLPKFKLENRPAGEMAVIRDLLCHRLGMQTFQGDFTFYNTNLTRDQVMQKLGELKATYPFRTKWGYTNAAFLTAGQIIPAVTGKPWEIFVRENI
ncbi:MAG TPA: serine hydrolase domain-containing protein, partial [Mucilaginibacter sp.]|nr:serine hydrolase domain-containing protein [Mucilaginibacter sp.]